MPVKTKSAKSKAARPTFETVMAELEAAGSAQTKKTYLRHGAAEPLFGVSFAVLKALTKRIGVDHDLALALWDTGNFDARNLAFKVVDPSKIGSRELDRWAGAASVRLICAYIGALAVESPHAAEKVAKWLASKDGAERCAGWSLLGALAMRDAATPDAFFAERLAEIERTIRKAPDAERDHMNQAVIAIGCRSAALRKAATAAAKRIGKIEVDHGDTACKTPDAAAYIEKTWAHSTSKGFESPAAHERTRESPRTRC